MGELPDGWVGTELSNIVDINPKSINDDDLECSFIPMSHVPVKYHGELKKDVVIWKDVKKGKTHFQDGDVIFAKITPCFENGKAAIITNLNNSQGAGSTEYFVLRSSYAIQNEYLFALLKSRVFLKSGELVMSGSVGHKRVPKDFVENYLISLPPLNEQIRIANKLDSLLAKVEAAQTRLDKIPTLLKRFRQSVLAAATSGELTTEWREINNLHRNNQKKTIGDLAEVQTGKTPLKSNLLFYENGDIPWLTSAVTGKSFVNSSNKFVTTKAVDECKLKIFRPGTLLVAMYGEGKTRGQVTETNISATINQACAAVIANTELINNSYLKLCIESNYEKTRLMAEGGNQLNLNLSKVKAIPILLPSKQEQKQIVRRVESLLTLADTVEKQYQQASLRTDKLTQSLLAKAFRGELVPQDPNDEPAEKLLAHIQAEREKLKSVKKNRKK